MFDAIKKEVLFFVWLVNLAFAEMYFWVFSLQLAFEKLKLRREIPNSLSYYELWILVK